MKLSLVFELLLIFVLLAFAASKSVRKQKNEKKGVASTEKDDKPGDNSINKYCKCSEAYCNCCREFQLPFVNLDGPGCASLMYLNGDKMSVSLSFGKRVITNRTLSGRKPSPVCMPLPGGLSKFCGRVYNIAKAGEDFRACLSLELQSKSSVEAAVRVSCFKFGPRGVNSEPADPLPLVPQDEKIEQDDDDDDDEDDDDAFGFDVDDDDDDDDDEEGENDTANDVESADYTGFSLLGEDILGDLFGSSGGKKTNKNKHKQAPSVSTTTTTTTKRPRPSRRPTRRPTTRTTTPRASTPRTTTVKVRPATRRPTRKPIRRPGRPRPTRPGTRHTTPASSTVTEFPSTTVSTTQTTSAASPVKSTHSGFQSTTEQIVIIQNDPSLEPIVIVTQRPAPSVAKTTLKPVTAFDDPLEMSLAHITGQLSAMPVTPILPQGAKDSGMTVPQDEINYEKIETVTPKTPTTIKYSTSSEEAGSDDIVQIVQSLDSKSEENEKDESRSHHFYSQHKDIVTNDFYEGLSLPKNKRNKINFDYEDLDVLDLTEMGAVVGDHLGLFNKNKRNLRNKKQNKIKDGKSHNDYDDILGLKALGETLGLSENNNKNKNKKNRSRQNKMMRGDWSGV